MERTDGKNSKLFSFSNRGKTARLQGFQRTKRTAPRLISSHVRYDHFDTSPCSTKIVYQTVAFVNDFMLKCFARYAKIYFTV